MLDAVLIFISVPWCSAEGFDAANRVIAIDRDELAVSPNMEAGVGLEEDAEDFAKQAVRFVRHADHCRLHLGSPVVFSRSGACRLRAAVHDENIATD